MATSSTDLQAILKRRRISDSDSEEDSDGDFKRKKSEVPDGVDLESRPKSAGCSREEMMDEDETERIRASRGDYELEFSCNGEVGLQQRRTKCDKNPGHLDFIPVEDFNIKHLPYRYRDNLLVDYVRAQSDITCRLSVSRISGDRPDTWPDSDRPYPFSAFRGKKILVTGTGWVRNVIKYTKERNINCSCTECRKPGNTPKKTWGIVNITTAKHVVYDDDEAIHTKCHFFYDSHKTDINKVPTLTGRKVYYSEIIKDLCGMMYYIHDVELLDRLDKMLSRCKDLRKKVHNKYLSNNSPDVRVPGVECDTNVDHDLCIIVSHPHGCSKVVTVGAWTRRDVVNEDSDDDVEDRCSNELIKYRYNTPTCPGSSGAGVFTLYKNIYTDNLYNTPAHSQGRPGNVNNSGVEWENVSARTSPVKMTDPDFEPDYSQCLCKVCLIIQFETDSSQCLIM